MSSLIAWLMSQCLCSGLECYRGVRNGLLFPLMSHELSMFVKENPGRKKLLENFGENIQPQRTILKLLSLSLKNSFLSDWRYGGRFRTAATSEMRLFVSKVDSCQPLMTIAKTSSILNIAVIVDAPFHVYILDNSLQVLQILNNL